MNNDLYYGTSGPHDAKIVLVGESWGEQEAAAQRPFVGTSGTELDRLLAEAGIPRDTVLCTNVIPEKPYGNETWRFFEPRSSSAPRVGGLIPSSKIMSAVGQLYRQLADHPRTLVIAAGNYALWSLSKVTGARTLSQSNGRKIPLELQTYAPSGILDWRGSMLYCEPRENLGMPSTPLLPIIHPAAIMREWYLRAPTLHDLKTRVPQALNSDWRPSTPPRTFSPPNFVQAESFLEGWLAKMNAGLPVYLANDIETMQHRWISCMGFADCATCALVIPFIRRTLDDGSLESYWTPAEEARLIQLIRRVLSHPNVRVIGQNYIYDTQYIQHWLGVTPRLDHDTMLAQNVLFPGTPKDLGYLSSLYCQYHWYWKDDVKDWHSLGNLQTLLDYNAIDVMRTWEIAQAQKQYAASIDQESQLEFKMKTNRLCLRMMNRGVLTDRQRAAKLLGELMYARDEFYRELLTIIPQDLVKPHTKKDETFWFTSSKQTAELFYDILGMQVVTHRKSGNRTVGKEALMALERKYPEFTGLFRRLDYAGSIANTINVVRTPVEPDSRIRCSYNPAGTETHRLSSSANVFGRGTNLQNLTKGEEDE